MTEDDKLLEDIIVGLKHLRLAFEKNDLDPPIAITVERRVHERLKVLHPQNMIFDPKARQMKITIAGIEFGTAL